MLRNGLGAADSLESTVGNTFKQCANLTNVVF